MQFSATPYCVHTYKSSHMQDSIVRTDRILLPFGNVNLREYISDDMLNPD